ncbi:MAG: hypothetical protein FJ104_02115 [Deltaproteobacteria bacterium]|nr:hypothetical protein [Deltaproteobacteria bacterium]
MGERRVGLAGVSEPRSPLGVPEGVEVDPPAAAFAAAVAELREQKVDVVVGLVAAPRGAALRLAEQVRGVDVLVVGKPFDRGEGNDAAIPPVVVEGTLVVEAPNHLQAIGVVDLFLRGAGPLADGTGVERLERRQSLQGRIAELERRLAAWREAGVQGSDVTAREADLVRLRAELAGQEAPPPPPAGSHFRYELVEVREGLGASAAVTAELDGYYRRVNEHNREALRDRRPRPAAAGEARYVGVETCAGCHAPAFEFWKQTPHAGAYAVLERQHKQFNLDCVSCHVTGYDRPGGSTVTHVEGLTSVQCEVCHGPGSLHEDDPESKAGIVARPSPGLCASTCHHPPHVPEGWDEATARKKILGPGHGAKAAP